MRARATVVAQAKLQRISATARAANAAGEGDDGAGDEEASAPDPTLKAPATAADRRHASKPRPRRQRKLRPGSRRRARWSCRRLDGLPTTNAARRALKTGTTTVRRASAGWMIQIGAPENLAKANALLARAQERNRSTLASAKPLTEKVRKGDATLYRARFAGLEFRFSGSRLPLAQTHRIFLLHRPRLTRTLSEFASLDAASEHPWPD